jgi:hypothetical protein
MSFPTIPEEDAESRWVKADPSIVISHLQDLTGIQRTKQH